MKAIGKSITALVLLSASVFAGDPATSPALARELAKQLWWAA